MAIKPLRLPHDPRSATAAVAAVTVLAAMILFLVLMLVRSVSAY